MQRSAKQSSAMRKVFLVSGKESEPNSSAGAVGECFPILLLLKNNSFPKQVHHLRWPLSLVGEKAFNNNNQQILWMTFAYGFRAGEFNGSPCSISLAWKVNSENSTARLPTD